MIVTFSEAARIAGVNRSYITKLSRKTPKEPFFTEIEPNITRIDTGHSSWKNWLKIREVRLINTNLSGNESGKQESDTGNMGKQYSVNTNIKASPELYSLMKSVYEVLDEFEWPNETGGLLGLLNRIEALFDSKIDKLELKA